MLRLIACCLCLLPITGFTTGNPILGHWSTCGNVKVGDARIELQKKYLFCCPDRGYTWTEITFDTTHGGRVLLSNCSAGNVPPGTITILAAVCAGHYGNWSYDASTSTLAITDSTTVYYLVSSITDSTIVLTKNKTLDE